MTDNAAPSPIRIDIISDIICPWCYIGKRTLEAALASTTLGAELHWQPFQLDRHVPEDGLDLRAYTARQQTAQEAEAVRAQASKAASEVGLSFAWDKITRMPNTRDAHRLIRHAALYGRQMKLVERLFQAYFCEGQDIGNRRILIELGDDCGIDAYASEALFAAKEDLLAIEEALALTRSLNPPKIPSFVFADEIIVPGVGSQELFTAALFRAQDLQSDPGLPS